jgi:hypothetical protein
MVLLKIESRFHARIVHFRPNVRLSSVRFERRWIHLEGFVISISQELHWRQQFTSWKNIPLKMMP